MVDGPQADGGMLMTHLIIQASCTNSDCLLEGEPQDVSATREGSDVTVIDVCAECEEELTA